MLNNLKTQIGRLRILAHLEGISFLVILFITMPLKYFMEMGQPNKVVGMIHGMLFILYILAVIMVKIEKSWKFKKTFIALIVSVIPFGTFWADKRIFREEE
jgi:integral membrane protein